MAAFRGAGLGFANSGNILEYYPDLTIVLCLIVYRDSDFSDSYSGVYDFGARYYNPLYGRWFAHDPAKQGINPYVYCGNNPVMSVDPDGRRWFGNQYSLLLNSAYGRIDELKSWMRSLKLILMSVELSEEEIKEARNGIISTRKSIKGIRQDIKNIQLLERDDEHIYQMHFVDEGPFGVHQAGFDIDGLELINIDYKTEGVGAHERAHSAQSLRAGEMKFYNGDLENAAYNNSYNETKTDKYATMNEVQAYQIQYSYDGALCFSNGVNMMHFKDINPMSISKILNGGRVAYPFAVRYNQRKK